MQINTFTLYGNSCIKNKNSIKILEKRGDIKSMGEDCGMPIRPGWVQRRTPEGLRPAEAES